MSTDIATYDAGPSAVAHQQDAMQNRAVARLGEWAHSAAAAYEVAKGLVDTAFVPAQFRGKPQEATAAILSGAEVGLSPMAALKAFDIIQGTAAPRALTLRAIVQSQGHEMVLEESTVQRCKMRGRRRGASEWVKVSWTIDRAKGLGLTGKDNWKKQPDAMLVARATGELARLIAADAILGIGYTLEEVADGADVTADVTAQVQPQSETRTMQRQPKDDSPEPEQTPPDAEGNPDAEPGMNEGQQKKMFAQFGELGITERDQYRDYISTVLGRQIESSKELTMAEASTVIEAQAAELDAVEVADGEPDNPTPDTLPTDGDES